MADAMDFDPADAPTTVRSDDPAAAAAPAEPSQAAPEEKCGADGQRGPDAGLMMSIVRKSAATTEEKPDETAPAPEEAAPDKTDAAPEAEAKADVAPKARVRVSRFAKTGNEKPRVAYSRPDIEPIKTTKTTVTTFTEVAAKPVGTVVISTTDAAPEAEKKSDAEPIKMKPVFKMPPMGADGVPMFGVVPKKVVYDTDDLVLQEVTTTRTEVTTTTTAKPAKEPSADFEIAGQAAVLAKHAANPLSEDAFNDMVAAMQPDWMSNPTPEAKAYNDMVAAKAISSDTQQATTSETVVATEQTQQQVVVDDVVST